MRFILVPGDNGKLEDCLCLEKLYQQSADACSLQDNLGALALNAGTKSVVHFERRNCPTNTSCSFTD